MKLLVLFSMAMLAGAPAALAQSSADPLPLASADVAAVAPALSHYAETTLAALWKRPGLSMRDRSIVTVAALIARNQKTELPEYVRFALDSGVKPSEISGIVTHLAFYAGWDSAISAVAVNNPVFAERKIAADQLAPVAMQLLPADEKADDERAKSVDKALGSAAPNLVKDTTDVLFRDLWLRPDLSPRDRSLVTISALIATGQFGQFPGHLVRALNNGLTQPEASEVISHLAYYGGWPNAFSAAAMAKPIFEQHNAQR